MVESGVTTCLALSQSETDSLVSMHEIERLTASSPLANDVGGNRACDVGRLVKTSDALHPRSWF